jgi:hypothetical protein
MGILDELSSATGDKSSNQEMVKQCLKTPALLHTIAEGLRTGTPKAKQDCAEVLAEVAEQRPDLLGEFVTDFLDASKSENKAVAKLGFAGLVKVTLVRPAEVYAERDYLLEAAKKNDAQSLGAASVLAALCGNNANYRGKLIGNVIRLLGAVAEKELPKWVAALAPAVEGSQDGVKRLTSALEPRLATLAPTNAQKIQKLLVKLERTTVKK